MKTEPTAGALKMAEVMRRQGCISDDDIQEWAALIDKETGLPEILEALEEAAADLASMSGLSAEGRRAKRIGEWLHKKLLAAQKGTK